MAIQQVASGSSNGIMSFLFQEDGSTEGTVLEGAEFAKTLHQLLGEYEGDDTATAATVPMSEELASVITDTEAELKALTAPLTQGLESLVKDFKLPAHSAKLPPEAGFEGEADGQEVEQPFWGIAPFTDVMTALREHTTSVQASATESEGKAVVLETTAATATEAKANVAANDPVRPEANSETPAAPVFTSGLAHVIVLARDAAQASTGLAQHAAPNTTQPTTGRNAPLSGKVLPQGLRPVTTALNQPAANSANAKATAQPVVATDIAQAMPDTRTTASTTFFADLLNAEAPAQQTTSPQSQAMTHVIQGLRTDNPVVHLPRATTADATPANPLPQMQSPHLAGTDAWFEDLGARVDWLKDMKFEKAELQLHPAELGLLDIQISTGDDGTTVSFVTHNTEARNLIEENMPRLRELLANQGMQLGQSHVSQHSEGQRRGHETHSGQGNVQRDNAAAEKPAPARRRAYITDANRIDHYV